jgi:hypothetical protein
VVAGLCQNGQTAARLMGTAAFEDRRLVPSNGGPPLNGLLVLRAVGLLPAHMLLRHGWNTGSGLQFSRHRGMAFAR